MMICYNVQQVYADSLCSDFSSDFSSVFSSVFVFFVGLDSSVSAASSSSNALFSD